MNSISSVGIDRLAEAIVMHMTVEIEASGRHVHLSREDIDALFGPGYQLTRVKNLSQPGQFACAERVTLVGPKGSLENVVILGPERPESQVEISFSDGVVLGLRPPVRLSGDTRKTPGILIQNGDRSLQLPQGVIVAKRHIHMIPEDAQRFGLEDGQVVKFATFTSRPLVFEDIEVRVSSKFATVAHLDYDESNACGYKKGDRGMILR